MFGLLVWSVIGLIAVLVAAGLCLELRAPNLAEEWFVNEFELK
ncbi:MAG: hypothetical protein ABH826_05050 [Patescibacteria group bacterium]